MTSRRERPPTTDALHAPADPESATAEAYCDSFAAEPPAVAAARTRAQQVPGADPVSPGAGAALAVLAAGIAARTVVAIGSGAGVTGLWLLEGMREDGVLTCLDSDPGQQPAARRAFAEAGYAQGRTRLIFGTPAEVLPRLSPGGYDLVVCATEPTNYATELDDVLGLLRPGGLLVCAGLLAGGRIADRSVRDLDTVAWREVTRRVREDDRLTSAVLPVGDGLLVTTTAR